jgi:hypothetical protein
MAARRALDDIQYSTQWIYYDTITNKPVAFGEIIKGQLENCYSRKQKGLVRLIRKCFLLISNKFRSI